MDGWIFGCVVSSFLWSHSCRYERRHKRKAEIRQQGLSSNPYQRGRLLEDDEEGEGPAREGEGQSPVGGGGLN